MLRRLIPTLLVLWLATPLLLGGDNLLTNPDFESNTTGWTFTEVSGNCSLARETNDGFRGTASMKILDSPGSDCNTSQVYQNLDTLVRNTEYHIRFGYRKTTGSLAFTMAVELFYLTSPFTVCMPTITLTFSNAWQVIDNVFTTTDSANCDGTASNRYRFRFLVSTSDDTGAGNEEWRFDDIWLCQGRCARTDRAVYLGDNRWRDEDGQEFSAWRIDQSQVEVVNADGARPIP